MEPTMNHAEELKSSGLKATLPRIKILEVFQQAAQRHMTAEEVYKILLNEGSDIGLATVYRVLMQFEQAGLLSRNHFEAGKAVLRTERRAAPRPPGVRALRPRGGVLSTPRSNGVSSRSPEERGYKLQDHALSLYVVCNRPECQTKAGIGGHSHHHG